MSLGFVTISLMGKYLQSLDKNCATQTHDQVPARNPRGAFISWVCVCNAIISKMMTTSDVKLSSTMQYKSITHVKSRMQIYVAEVKI